MEKIERKIGNSVLNARQINLCSNLSESFNLLLHYLRGLGFDLQAFDRNNEEINFFKAFSEGKTILIDRLKISWLAPERITEGTNKLSFGNVTSHKAINARTLKPEPGGLFDPRIFGPFLNYECYCGKYEGKGNKGQKCETCEVLIAEKNLQR